MTQLDSALRKAFAAQRAAHDLAPRSPAAPVAPPGGATVHRTPTAPASNGGRPGTADPGLRGSAVPVPRLATTGYQAGPYAEGPGIDSPHETLSIGDVRQRIRRRQAALRRPDAVARAEGYPTHSAYGPVERPASSVPVPPPEPAATAAGPSETALIDRIRTAVAGELARHPFPPAAVVPTAIPAASPIEASAEVAPGEQTLDVVRRQGEELARIIIEIRQREKTITSRESDLSRREQGLADQESRLAVLRSTLDRRAEDLSAREKTLSDREVSLREAADRLQAETVSLKRDRDDLVVRLAAVDEEAGRLEAARTDLELERSAWKKQRDEIAAQEHQLAAARRTVAVQSKAIAASEAELNKLRTEIGQQQAHVREARAMLDAESTGLRSRTSEMEARATELDRRASDLEERLEDVSRREATLQQTEQEVKTQHSRLRQREAELKLRQSALQQREADLKDQESLIRSEMEACHAVREDLTAQESWVHSQQSDLEQRAALIRQQQEVLLEQLAEVTAAAEQEEAAPAPTVDSRPRSETAPVVTPTPVTAIAQPEAAQRLSADEWEVLTGARPATESAADADLRAAPASRATSVPSKVTAPAGRGEELLTQLDSPGSYRIDAAADPAPTRPHAARAQAPRAVALAVGADVQGERVAASLDESTDVPDEGVTPVSNGQASATLQVSGTASREPGSASVRSVDHEPETVSPRDVPSGSYGRSEPGRGGSEVPKTLRLGELSPADLAAIRSLWEVDRWEWPTVVSSVSQMLGPALEAAGSRLVEEAKGGRKVWAVGSIGRGCGATTVACCLAQWAGRAGVDTILVDANFTDPDLATQFDLGAEVCWSETLRGAQPWGESTITSLGDRVTLAPLVRAPELPRVNALIRRMGQALAPIRAAYDLILVDVPSFGDGVSMDLAGCFDAALIVTDGTAAQADHCREVREQMKAAGVRPVFFVENRIEETPAAAGL